MSAPLLVGYDGWELEAIVRRGIHTIICLLCILLTTVSAHALDPMRSLTQYLHRTWQIQQGLPRATIYCLQQTRDGYLWLGTQSGLIRFDGIRFVPLSETKLGTAAGTSLDNIWVRDLLADATGGLWVASIGEGLIHVEAGKMTRYSVHDGLPSDNAQCLLLDSRGDLWICTPGGMARFSKNKFFAFQSRHGLASDDVRVACEANDGRIWCAGDAAAVSVWNGSEFESQPLTSVPQNTVVLDMRAARDGALWIGTTNGLVRLKDGREQCFTTANGLPDNRVQCLAESRESGLWIGTKDGFSRFRYVDHGLPGEEGHDGEIESFRASEGLSQSTVYTLFEDREGSLWVGTKYGLNQFVDRRFVPFTASEGLSSNDTGPVFQDRAGNIWVGTLGAGLNRFDGHHFSVSTIKQGLASNSVTAMGDDREGNLWVGTDKGLNRLRDGRVTASFTKTDGLPAEAIRCVFEDRRGVLWVGTNGGPAVLKNGKFAVPEGTDAAPLREPVLAMAEDRAGGILAATEDGRMFAYRGESWREISRDAPAWKNIDAFCEDKDGLLWMGTMDDGLRLLDGDKVASYSMKDGLFDDEIFGIASDDHDRLWMACSKGIFWVSRSDLRGFAAGRLKSFVSTPFSPTDALRTIECKSGVQPAAWRTREGQLWFSTIRGVIVIDSARLVRKAPPLPVFVEEVIVNGKSEEPDRIQRMPPGVKNLEFRYAGLSFLSPSRMTFRYKLEGFDKDWVDAGMRREAMYTNLPPGKYEFRVIASGVDGAGSQSAAPVAFALAPHVYQRWWFIPLMVMLAAMSAVLVYRVRVRRVREQLGAILAERGRIARELHDTLLQGFSGVTMEMQGLSARLPDSEQRSILEDIIHDAGNCMREARRSVAGLRNPRGPESGLAAAIAQAATQMTEAKNIRLRLKLEQNPRGLAADVEYNLLRIAVEAIANAVKHSGSRAVEVALESTAEFVTIHVKDDGVGFAAGNGAAAEHGHYGLIGMKERASQIGAELWLQSEPGRGTEVCVRLAVGRVREEASS